MFSGHLGAALDWHKVMDAIEWADVVIVGEEHDDAMGHAVQRAIVENVTAACPGPCCALSMEMLERDEQPLVDDFLEGIIDAATLEKSTFSENWGGEGGWKKWYAPIVDVAKAKGARIIAANAPRRYVRLARSGGYARLRNLPAERRRLFDLPRKTDDAAYKARFDEVMLEGGEVPATQPSSQPATAPATMPTTAPSSMPATAPASRPDEPAGHGAEKPTPAQLAASYRSQCVWDATMAESIARARRHGAKKVIHLVGAFHCDFEGGLVQQVRARLPGAKILVISMHPGDSMTLQEDDRGRADVVICTGQRTEPETEPQSQPTTTAPSPVAANQPSS